MSLSQGKGFPDIENKLDWHGKPLGEKTQAALETIKSLIKNPGPHGIKPLQFVDDAPLVDLTNVRLSEPPKYSLGDQVRHGGKPIIMYPYTA